MKCFIMCVPDQLEKNIVTHYTKTYKTMMYNFIRLSESIQIFTISWIPFHKPHSH